MTEPLSPTPLHPVHRAVFTQHWRDLTMLHWPVDPARVAPLLPRGTVPDVLEGTTYVGLVPFAMSGVRILGTPPLPYLSGFAETNVRLYAVDAHGRRGVVFRSLEASRLLPVLAARAGYHLPYRWARMTVRHGASTVAYSTARRWPGPRGAGGVVRVRVGARLAEPGGAPHVLWSPGVRARIGRPAAGARRGLTTADPRQDVAMIWALLSSRIRTWLLFALVMPVAGRLLEAAGVRAAERSPRAAQALGATGRRLRDPRGRRRRRF